jgi:hypothetical protein
MDIKTSFFDVMSEVQEDLEDVTAGIGKFFKNPMYKNIVRNLIKVAEVNFDLAW